MNGNSCAWHRGKVIGGTSVVNGMLYVRGSKEDFNEWHRLGNPGWSYEDVLPFFKKSEDQQNVELSKDTRYHSTGGLLPVSTPTYQTPLTDAFLDAVHYRGHKLLDINGEDDLGFSHLQATIKNGKRFSTAKAFLKPALYRKNLHIVLNAYVTKILLSEPPYNT
jgi:choline dehydrogenase